MDEQDSIVLTCKIQIGFLKSDLNQPSQRYTFAIPEAKTRKDLVIDLI